MRNGASRSRSAIGLDGVGSIKRAQKEGDMAIYVDSADAGDARRAKELGFVKGVTTNPVHIAKTGRPGLDVLRELLETFDGPVFYQVTASTVEERIAQVSEAHNLGPGRVVIKVPATTDNYTIVSRLAPSGITFCVTAACSAAQAYLAAQAGARYVAPYVNRLTRQLGDGLTVVRDMARILEGTPTSILAASLKSVDEVVASILAGAGDVTMPLELILALGEHELSQQAIAEFSSYLPA
jgi:transaldolase